MSTKRLHPSPDLALPLDAVTETFAILAVKRAGKSNTAVAFAEEMYDAGLPWTAIDPKGDWWGVRSAGDGKAPGLRVTVFGGLHADVPLEPTAGKLIAELVAERRITCVLDVSEMTKADQRRFLTAFAERLYKINREPMHLFCEEADEYIPQQVKGEAAAMVGTFETLVKRGGFRGIGVTLVTQRSASLNKDVLTQAGTLIAMRTPSPQDQEQVLRWIKQHGASDKVMSEIGTLANGEAWVFSTTREPALQKVKFRRRRTFDSGATPKVGEKIRPPSVLADVDLDAIREAMAETIERAKLDDPKALRAELARLKAELAKKPAPVVAPPIEVQAVSPDTIQKLDALVARVRTTVDALVGWTGGIETQLARVKFGGGSGVSIVRALHHGRPIRSGGGPVPVPKRIANPPLTNGLPKGARDMLAALAGTLRPSLSKNQVATLAELKVTGGTFAKYLSILRTGALVEDRSGELAITEAGVAAIGGRPPAPSSTAELVDGWKAKLPGKAKDMLDLLVANHPRGLTRERLAEMVEVEASGGTFAKYLSVLSSNGLVERRGGELVASDTLFMEARAHG